METGLKNSVVLVTGGAGGIGQSICKKSWHNKVFIPINWKVKITNY